MTHSPLARTVALAAAAVLGGGLLTACGSTAAGDEGDGPRVVASTTVYADIAEQVAGEHASVESVISDPAADPHSYEASPADAAAVSTADLVVYNGAGYDAFVDMALENADDVSVVRATDEFAHVTSTEVAGQSHDHDGHDHGGDAHDHGDDGHNHDHSPAAPGTTTNEHVWFHLPTMGAVAEQIAEELATLDAENADSYRENASTFTAELDPLVESIDTVHDRGHFSYAQTEPIGAHLFDMAHMEDRTPPGFLSSISDDTDPSAADLTAMLDLLRAQEVDFLAFNAQTETSVTARVREEAESAGVVVVELTETLPDGADYLRWMTGIVEDLTAALDGAEPTGDGGH